MKLNELINGIETVEITGDTSVEISSLAYDSRKVTPGALFVAVRGFAADGNIFIAEAVNNGAVAVMTEDSEIRQGAISIRVQDARKTMALISDRLYGSPQKSLVMTGVTGTNGKTTTTYMIKSIFDVGGMNSGVIGTIHHIVDGERIVSANTTPEAPDIHSFLARMVEAQQNSCVIEISSHALVLCRVHGIQFRAVAFLNLSRDHLDFHGDIKNYLEAKSILFSDLTGDATAVVNLDDPYSDHIMHVSRSANITTFGNDYKSDIRPISINIQANKSEVKLATPAGEMEFSLPIPGRYNIWNAMAATGISLACGFPKETIIRGLETVKMVRGRFEIVNEGQDFTVIIDYAHTPDALEGVLSTARELTCGRLISVFGCGGDRDRGKRPLMGEISAKLADFTVITNDNPRTEDPSEIISDILKGLPSQEKCEVVP
ncbi:MAG: UDP-N-acetylmuramoyl-L-alanyl-D-glutamate--2,6-diaminopimelate ligase, partial [Candidatus Latescibacteria bacterium]|nr:UDP-N-acetylmuramoyl-L-alanyl-D-glutamate--2,6-diaminopimelate ligase [Candidatus Latescibacterota bacterium]